MGGRGSSSSSSSTQQIVFAPIKASSERQRQYAKDVRAQMVNDLMRGGGYVSKDRNEDDFGPDARKEVAAYIAAFWSSADLTGNQTAFATCGMSAKFWSSADLTGNQTACSDVGGEKPRHRPRVAIRSESPCR